MSWSFITRPRSSFVRWLTDVGQHSSPERCVNYCDPVVLRTGKQTSSRSASMTRASGQLQRKALSSDQLNRPPRRSDAEPQEASLTQSFFQTSL